MIDKNKKAAIPLWAATQEITASIHPDKDVNLNHKTNLSVTENQLGTPGKTYLNKDATGEGHSHQREKNVFSKRRQLSLLDLKGVGGRIT